MELAHDTLTSKKEKKRRRTDDYEKKNLGI